MDFIFIIGPSAVGKTTLAKELYKHYNGVYIEQNMVPEFFIPNDIEDVGIYEEQLCWENTLAQVKFFHDKGLRNIVALDFDDIRTRELPIIFRGFDFITFKLISSDINQIKRVDYLSLNMLKDPIMSLRIENYCPMKLKLMWLGKQKKKFSQKPSE